MIIDHRRKRCFVDSRDRLRPKLVSAALFFALVSAAGADEPKALSRADGSGPARTIRVSFGKDRSPGPLDGRMLVVLSTDPKTEPRFQMSDGPKTQQIFGIDVDGLAPDQEAVIDESVLGFPLESLRQVPPGTYWIQAVLHKYETFHRGDGHVVKLPMDRGEGQQWNKAPGNLYSTPREITIEAGAGGAVSRRCGSTRSSRPCPSRRRPSTSSTSESKASGSPSSGAGRCTWRAHPPARRI